LQCIAVCCSVLQCVAVCCSVLQYVAVCCSMLQCVAVCCSVSHRMRVCEIQCLTVYMYTQRLPLKVSHFFFVSQNVCMHTFWDLSRSISSIHTHSMMCCSVLQYVAVCCRALQCVAVRCSVLQCVEWHSTCNASIHTHSMRYYRVAKTHRMPYLIDHFPQISHWL